MATKLINLCDACGKETDMFHTENLMDLCEGCNSIASVQYERAMKVVQSRVDFSVVHRLVLLSLISNFADGEKQFGTSFEPLRQKIIESYSKG